MGYSTTDLILRTAFAIPPLGDKWSVILCTSMYSMLSIRKESVNDSGEIQELEEASRVKITFYVKKDIDDALAGVESTVLINVRFV